MIELKHLRTLQTLRDTGSLVAAASQLHVSQSALSHQLHDIEHRLGCKFFLRKSQPLQFSQQGQILLTLADTILPKVNEAVASCKQSTLSQIKLAIDCHSCIQWLMPTIKKFKHSNPKMVIEFITNNVFNLHTSLLEGHLDLLMSSDKHFINQLHYTPLFDFEVRLAFSPDHEFRNKSLITVNDLADQLLLTYPIEKHRLDIWQYFLAPAQITPRIKSVDNTALLIQMVSAGMGVTALPHWAIYEIEQQGLIMTRPLGEGLWRRLYGVTREPISHHKAMKTFIALIKQQLVKEVPSKAIR